ncbi:MAG: hypothetical protein JNL67_01250 [Planctomycetaceae bacterium]|nr:hypothetical protein [Planctomycetaceae bacterium]
MFVESESWLRRILILGGATFFGLVSASVALADHGDWRTNVRDHADNVNYLSREVRHELIHVANHSCLFGQMMAEVGRMETNAAILRGWARHQAPLQLESKIHELAANSDRLQALIEEAWQRGQRGVHRPLLCTQQLRRLMAQVDAEIFAAYQSIPGPRVVYSAPHRCDHWGGGHGSAFRPSFPGDSRHHSHGSNFEVNLGNGIRISNGSGQFGSDRIRFEDNGPAFSPGPTIRIGGVQVGFEPNLGRHSMGRRYPDTRGSRR